MNVRKLRSATGALIVLAAIVVGATIGGSAANSAPTTGRAGIKVALVTDVGGLDDKGYNQLAYKGLTDAEAKLGISGRVFLANSASDFVPNLATAARLHYDLIIGVGFDLASPVETVAKSFPKSNFAIIDYSWSDMKSHPKNVRGLVFAEQQGGYLAGVAAAAATKTGIVSTVGGEKEPPVDAYIAGFQQGARATKPNIKLLNGYSQDFVDQAKCKEIALNQISAGSDVVFQVAGGCGLGALDAAKQKHVWGIGVDADQSFLGSYILTSAQKKVNEAVYQTIQLVKSGHFKGGTDTLFNAKSGGIAFGKISPKAPAGVKAKLVAAEAGLVSGRIKVSRILK